MSNVEVYLVVEGATEQTFVREVLAPYVAQKSIFLYPALIGKAGHKGGDIRFERANNDIGNFLRQRTGTFVSTMLDFFKIDTSWPGHQQVRNAVQARSLSSLEKAQIIEDATSQRIAELFSDCDAQKRFIPYVEMHEFEAILFSDAQVLSNITNIPFRDIQRIIDDHDNPEEINDDPTTAPSKRLAGLKRDYRKVAMGKEISEAIGIDNIRIKCPNFNRWLSRLESLTKTN